MEKNQNQFEKQDEQKIELAICYIAMHSAHTQICHPLEAK